MGRFCFWALASFCLVRKDLWDCVVTWCQRESVPVSAALTGLLTGILTVFVAGRGEGEDAGCEILRIRCGRCVRHLGACRNLAVNPVTACSCDHANASPDYERLFTYSLFSTFT